MREGGRGGGQDGESSYRLAGGGREAAEGDRLNLLEQIFAVPAAAGHGAARLAVPGGRAGRGSMAVWLAGQVGPAGRVVATDIDVTYLRGLDVPNLEVVEHDIMEDPADALGAGSFDLVCSRLMLFHLTGARKQRSGRWRGACARAAG